MSHYTLVFQEPKNGESVYAIMKDAEQVGWAILHGEFNETDSSAVVVVENQKPMLFRGYFQVLEAILEHIRPEWGKVRIFQEKEISLGIQEVFDKKTEEKVLVRRRILPFAKVVYDDIDLSFRSVTFLGDILIEDDMRPKSSPEVIVRVGGEEILHVSFKLSHLIGTLLAVQQKQPA